MNRKMTNQFMAVVVMVISLLGCGSFAFAEEGTVKAMAPWKGQGFVFPVGEDTAYMVAVYSGTMFVEDAKGALHQGSIVCPGTAEGNFKTMTKTGQGRCIITNEDGDRIYARFSCTGDMEGCRGTFKLDGGTGRFAGITGEGEMVSQLQARAVTVVAGYDPVRQESEGVIVWPKLKYNIPEAK